MPAGVLVITGGWTQTGYRQTPGYGDVPDDCRFLDPDGQLRPEIITDLAGIDFVKRHDSLIGCGVLLPSGPRSLVHATFLSAVRESPRRVAIVYFSQKGICANRFEGVSVVGTTDRVRVEAPWPVGLELRAPLSPEDDDLDLAGLTSAAHVHRNLPSRDRAFWSPLSKIIPDGQPVNETVMRLTALLTGTPGGSGP
ncbi:MAG: hypothetical protein ACRCYU_23530 [Nocardioides sp.]